VKCPQLASYALTCAVLVYLTACASPQEPGVQITTQIGTQKTSFDHYDIPGQREVSFESGPYQITVTPNVAAEDRVAVILSIIETATGRDMMGGARLSVRKGSEASVTLQSKTAPEMHLKIAYARPSS